MPPNLPAALAESSTTASQTERTPASTTMALSKGLPTAADRRQINPGTVSHATSPSGRRIPALTGRQKAAILVRLLLDEGADLPLSSLPEDMQTSLTEQMAQLRLVDRDTLSSVVREFIETLEQVGLSFSGGIEGALARLGDRLSPAAAERLRAMARARGAGSAWDTLARADADSLLPLLAGESAEVAAVVLSKLDTGKAAGLLGQMPGERARRIACAMPLTASIAPHIVSRIGDSLAGQLDDRPRPAFVASPGERFGAILNVVPAETRENLLRDIESTDAGFADSVRKNIFTFSHVPERIEPRDVPKILRDVAQEVLITALAAALQRPESADAATAEFLLANMSQRLATTLRDEVAGMGRVKARDAETAQNAVISTIRALLDDGIIALRETVD